ncbi:MAG: tRNA 2-selenouridine(34) synthase MnmH [Saprospiraceae bacterium]|nr:tRNA 2-selenouridine(34) synthase MnmH [Saprospiraceae bacterium]
MEIEEWIQDKSLPILDVRSPAEFNHAHVTGAISLPLFSDEERALIGTTYKQIDKSHAMMLALEYVGPRMTELVNLARTAAPEEKIRIHCWRGGMRSGSVAWLLNTMGFDKVHVLNNGYKAYRHWALAQFETNYPILVLGGKTGSAKTEILKVWSAQNAATINLEGLAHHKGSAFGWIGEADPPTQEQFENDLATSLYDQKHRESIWFEDESERIGLARIPTPLYKQMRASPLYFLDIPKTIRIPYLIESYAHQGDEKLALSILRISKKLGGANTKLAIQALHRKDYEQVADLVLYYYDKSYETGLSMRDTSRVIRIHSETIDPVTNAQLILQYKLKTRHGTHQTHPV